MRNSFKKIIAHPLISGSTIIVVGSMSANIFNYFFNLAMGRLLPVSDYGTLASLVSIFNILAVFSTTILTVFAKFSASFVGQGKPENIGGLLKKGSKFVLIISIIICGILMIITPLVSSFLNVKNYFLIYITFLGVFGLYLSSVPIGILQGLMKFFSFSLVNLLSSIGKLVFGYFLVTYGFGVGGGISALFLSVVIGYIVSYIPLRSYLIKTKDNIHIPNLHRELSLYGLPVLLSGIGMTAFGTLDVILVKHLYSSTDAGQYAALSLMGRSIFYAVGPVTFVAFPLIAQKREKNEHLFGTVMLSLALIGIPSLILSGIYFLFPELILKIFFPGPAYKSLSPYLGPYSIYILFFSLAWLFNSFYLSIGKTKVFAFTIFAAILQALLVFTFHEDILQIIYNLIGVSFLLLISLLIYYPYTMRK